VRHIRSLKQYSRLACAAGLYGLNGDNHHLIAAAKEKLLAIRRPNRLPTPIILFFQAIDGSNVGVIQ